MIIEEGEYKIKLTSYECYEIAWSLRQDLLLTIQSHWVNHLDVNWKEIEKAKLARIEMFFNISLYPVLYKAMIDEFDKLIQKEKDKQCKQQ